MEKTYTVKLTERELWHALHAMWQAPGEDEPHYVSAEAKMSTVWRKASKEK